MIAYPDTSFLCAIYRQQDNSSTAAAYFQKMREPLHVSSLLLFEFKQSLRFQVWLNAQNPRKGFSKKEGEEALHNLESDIKQGVLKVVPADWPVVHHKAEDLSGRYTTNMGIRSFDLLHVATAIHLEASVFLSFDDRQRELALLEGLKVHPNL